MLVMSHLTLAFVFLIITKLASAVPTPTFFSLDMPQFDESTPSSSTLPSSSAYPTTTTGGPLIARPDEGTSATPSWPWWITPASYGLVCYDVIVFVIICWMIINGCIEGIWDCGRSARRERRLANAWWAERDAVEEAERRGSPERLRTPQERERERVVIERDEVVRGEMRRLGFL